MKDRLEPFRNNAAFKGLSKRERLFLEERSELYQLTHQDIKILIDISRDLNIWDEGSLADYWKDPTSGKQKGKQQKQKILEEVKKSWNELKNGLKDYSSFSPATHKNPTINYTESDNSATILGKCPVASEKTRCCNLMTLDIVNNCGFDCSYCSIQSFFDNDRVYFQKNLKEKLENIKLDPDNRYHIGTGQSSDSLMWGNKEGILDLICDFAGSNPNVILELKTKSKNVSWFLENDIPSNMIITWSLNTNTIIKNEEHLTASLDERLDSARKIADRGIITGFHFHPMVYYKGWEQEYENIFKGLQESFKPEEIALVSLGTLTFIKPVVKKIRNRELKSKILQMPLENADGKLSYPLKIKQEMFTKAYNSFSREWKEKVFFYLCMENESLWEPVFGRKYTDNENFEKQMIDNYFRKVKK